MEDSRSFVPANESNYCNAANHSSATLSDKILLRKKSTELNRSIQCLLLKTQKNFLQIRSVTAKEKTKSKLLVARKEKLVKLKL